MIQTSCKWKITRRMCLANGQHPSKIGAKRYHGSCPRDIHGSCLLLRDVHDQQKQHEGAQSSFSDAQRTDRLIKVSLKFPALQAHTVGSKVP